MYALAMNGAVAAGDRHTAEAAALMLRRGGNAVDAAVAGAFASFVAEPLLASAGGAGMLTLALPGEDPTVVDFFPRAPGLGGRPDELDFVRVDIDFGSAIQSFHAGRGSAAPPLALPGLLTAAERFGTLPIADLVSPAVRMATEGVALSAEAAHVYQLLWSIQTLSEDPVALAGGRPPLEGHVLRNRELAALLEDVASQNRIPPSFIDAIVAQFGPDVGGLLGERDLAAACPSVVAPRSVQLENWTALTSPRPGGALVEIILRDLFRAEPRASEDEENLRVAEACRAGHLARAALEAHGSTTHVSVIDAQGGAASVTLTNGEGSGHVVRGFGVQMNNFLGEEDLNPDGFHRHAPGATLPTMIAPTVGLHRGRPALALGSGGSNRIRSVIAQVLYRVMRGEPVEHAVTAPRIHAERDDVWLELVEREDPAAVVGRLRECFARVHAFETRAFFFGGVHTVLLDDEGRIHAAGDSRRGGAVVYP